MSKGAPNEDDHLVRAAAALRSSSTPALSATASRTRARVLLAASARTKRRNVTSLVLPIAALIALSTAWGATRGASSRWRPIARYFGAETDAPSAIVAPNAATRAPAPVVPAIVAVPNVEAEVPISAAISQKSPEHYAARSGTSAKPRAASATASSATPSSSSPLSSTSSPPAASNEDARAASLYAAAHRAHFVDRDPAAALGAWDAYLAAAPDGAFAPEARYNRALTLVRLGRRDDARRALAPFVAAGGYRARDASSLLDALGTE